MQTRTPFLFSMPPVFAALLGFTSSLALLFAIALVFADSEAAGEPAPTDGTDEAAVRQVDPLEQAAYLGLLIVPVGLIPMTARRKGRNGTRWAAAGVGAGLAQLLLPGFPIHPLMPLLTLVFLRPRALAGPPSGELRRMDGGAAAPAAALPASAGASADAPREAPPARRRGGLRRRRASRGPRRRGQD